MVRNVKDLDVYNRPYRMALEIHDAIRNFPAEERYELASQFRRTSKSIPTNIHEGFGRQSSRAEYIRFLIIARASCDEMFTHINFAKDLNYIDEVKFKYFVTEYEIVGKELTNLIKKWKQFK